MDYTLLRSWLGLAPGAWPPDHYSLLGLSPASTSSAAIERVVLTRMDNLRPHQLLHPELVTEGMNRLAQALICLTDTAARAAYDADLGSSQSSDSISDLPRNDEKGKTSASASESETQSIFDSLSGFPTLGEEAEAGGIDMTQVLDVRYEPGLAPPEAPAAYEIIEAEIGEPLSPAFEVVEENDDVPAGAPSTVIEARSAPSSAPLWLPASRRALFRRLAAIRRLQAPWQKLKPFLGNPREPIDRPIQVLLLLEVVADLRPLMGNVPGLIGKLSEPGGLVAAVLRQPLSLHTIRSLLPDQRQAIADDWERAELALIRESARLRELVRSGRPFRQRIRKQSSLWRSARWLMKTPESLLLAITLLIAFAALLRSSLNR